MITKIRIHLKSLLAMLDQAGKTVSTKTTLPILECILLTVETEALIVSATDLEQFFSTRTTVVVEGDPCAIALPFAGLSGFLKTCKAAEEAVFEIEAETQRVTVKVGRARARMTGQKAEEFPTHPIEGDATLSFDAPALKSAIVRTLPCVSSDIARAALNCLQLANIGGKTRLTGTDGIHLSTLVLEGKLPKKMSILLPRNPMKSLAALLPKDGNVAVNVAERSVLFAWGDTHHWVILQDGEYPAWSAAVPEKFAHTVPVNASEMLAAVKTATVFAEEAAVRLSPEGEGALQISGGQQDGSASVELDMSFPFEVAFNGKLLTEMLGLFGDRTVSLGLINFKAPAVFQDGDFTGVLMPVLVEHPSVKAAANAEVEEVAA
jgi:DNA polymerase-3 subunit beta